MKYSEIVIESPEEKVILADLAKREDTEGLRLKRYLRMPDLSREEGSPIHELAKRIVGLPDFDGFEVLKVPEIVSAKMSFDLFNFPADHPARNRSDTYYVYPVRGSLAEVSQTRALGASETSNGDYILRTHTTVMWYYHVNLPQVKEKMMRGEAVGAFSYGKVYRKDELDRNHMNVFHQMDGWYLCRKSEKEIGVEDLKRVLVSIAEAIYGKDIEYRFNKDTFPYTDPSLEMEIQVHGKWVEVLGSGVVHPKVLENLSVDSKVWNGWAFGFGLERLAILSMNLPDIRLLWSEDPRVMHQLKLGQEYEGVSKYPPITRDISFVVGMDFIPNNYFDLIRDIGGDLVEEVSLLDKYESEEKFGKGKVSYTYRTIYRSNERTLTNEEIDALHKKIEEETKKQFGAEVR